MRPSRDRRPALVPASYTVADLRAAQSPPQEALESLAQWTAYMDANKEKMSADIYHQALEQRESLWKLARMVAQKGGWLKVTGLNLWADLEASLSLHGAREMYEVFLLPLEKRKELALRYHPLNPFLVEIKLLKYHCIQPIPIFTPPETGIIDESFWASVMSQDIAILRGFLDEVWPLDNSLFSPDFVEKHHGSEVFDVLSQDREPDCTPNQVHTGSKEPISIREYISEMRKEIDQGVQPTDQVKFGINIDIGTWAEHMNELRKTMPKRLVFGSEVDALEYARAHVYGMTLPQMYLKVTGCWTGAHQENLNFAAINLNHGPGVCEWWGLDPRCTRTLRREVRERLGFDIYHSETLWWPDENVLMSRNYTTYYGEQMPGDIVYVGPATLHWVKSLSPTVNTAWNIGQKTLTQFKYAFERDRSNHNISFESLIQMHTLSMDLLNAELTSLPDDLVQYLYDQLVDKYRKEQELIRKCNIRRFKSAPEHQVYRCDKCREELFLTYATCNLCENEAYCLLCVSLHDKSHRRFVYWENIPLKSIETLFRRVRMSKEEDMVLRKCYIPDLSQGLNRAEKYNRLGAVYSAWTGSPDYIQFGEERETTESDAEELKQLKRKRTHSSGKKYGFRKKEKTGTSDESESGEKQTQWKEELKPKKEETKISTYDANDLPGMFLPETLTTRHIEQVKHEETGEDEYYIIPKVTSKNKAKVG